jgi:RNA polymerase sigma factor (TIGR02999 family)
MLDSHSNDTGVFVELMRRFRQGDVVAAGRLVETLYPELRRLAAQKMARQPADHSWQPTLLVHELFLRLRQIEGLAARPKESPQNAAQEKAWFLNLAGMIMQRKLIDHARPLSHKAQKLDMEIVHSRLAASASGQETLQYVEDLLSGLDTLDPQLRTVVEGRVFLGETLAEIAVRLNCSERTAAAYWRFARTWLAERMDLDAQAA